MTAEEGDQFQATRDAVAALTDLLRKRDALICDGGEVPDAEFVAIEFWTAMRGHGWRPTAARRMPHWKAAVSGQPATPEARQTAIDEYLSDKPWMRRARGDRDEEDGAS
jgi:hypothetical protein